MIAFEIEINGNKLCTAGVESKYGVLSSILSWAKRDISQLPDEVKTKVPEEELKLTIGGHITHSRDDGENLNWPGQRLKSGDQIRINIIETDKVDEPLVKKRHDPKFVEEQKRKYYEELKKKFE